MRISQDFLRNNSHFLSSPISLKGLVHLPGLTLQDLTGHPKLMDYPKLSGNLTVCYGKLSFIIYSWFTHEKWWFSIAMLNYQRVIIVGHHFFKWRCHFLKWRWQCRQMIAQRSDSLLKLRLAMSQTNRLFDNCNPFSWIFVHSGVPQKGWFLVVGGMKSLRRRSDTTESDRFFYPLAVGLAQRFLCDVSGFFFQFLDSLPFGNLLHMDHITSF